MEKLLQETHDELMKIKTLTKIVDEKLVNLDSQDPVLDEVIQLASMAYDLTHDLEDKVDKGLLLEGAKKVF